MLSPNPPPLDPSIGTAEQKLEESHDAAKLAKLKYVSDASPGITRKHAGAGFTYVSPAGKPIRDFDTVARIKSLVIPPAWTDVWICPDADGHIQAVGRDQRGRKQYRYHARWREVRDENKYGRMIAFGQALPKIRAKVHKDLARPGLPREKVLAAVISVMEKTLIRVGNDEYAKQNDSFGLTTLRDKHADVNGSRVRFRFTGKSGKDHEIDFADKRLARIVAQCQDLPGYELFQYLNGDGQVKDITSTDVNHYLRHISGEDFTAKDFRTWAGTVLAARALQELKEFTSQRQAKKNIVRAVEVVAMRLGNTTAVCRKCYIHPKILDTYLDGMLVDNLTKRVRKELSGNLANLPAEEAAVLALLERGLEKDANSGPGRRKQARR